jgi:uncharacterized protein YjbI with pentapeptide repeats
MSVEQVDALLEEARNAHERPNLVGAALAYADLSGKNFSGANLSGVRLSGARLNGCNFSGALLTQADFSEAQIQGTNFTAAHVFSADFSEVSFEKVTLTDAVFTDTFMNGAKILPTSLATLTDFEPFSDVSCGEWQCTEEHVQQICEAVTTDKNAQIVAAMNSDEVALRMAAAENPHAAESVLLQLAGDDDRRVRECVSLRKDCPDAARVLIALKR